MIDIINELRDYGIEVQVCDPLADPSEAQHEYRVELVPFDRLQPAEAVVVAVPHQEYRRLSIQSLRGLMNNPPLLIDVKGIYARDLLSQAGIRNWRL
jgi:UDP-N-acetyl-D-galactosamine dehydrogenase